MDRQHEINIQIGCLTSFYCCILRHSWWTQYTMS